MKTHAWLSRFFEARPHLTHEARYQKAALTLLDEHLECDHVTPEAWITPSLRVDLAAQLPVEDGVSIFVECKNFGQSITDYVDAVMQAASYADAMQHPVFIGPFDGTRTTLCNGHIDDGMSVLHIMAGRLNVGFLAVSDAGEVQLILRGVVVYSSRSGKHSQFSRHFGYITRTGSKQSKK